MILKLIWLKNTDSEISLTEKMNEANFETKQNFIKTKLEQTDSIQLKTEPIIARFESNSKNEDTKSWIKKKKNKISKEWEGSKITLR